MRSTSLRLHYWCTGVEDNPWWTYGAQGMQLWFPSTSAGHPMPGDLYAHRAMDPELEFDPEVYPIGISFAEVSIIGKGTGPASPIIGVGLCAGVGSSPRIPLVVCEPDWLASRTRAWVFAQVHPARAWNQDACHLCLAYERVTFSFLNSQPQSPPGVVSLVTRISSSGAATLSE